jgi:hypothetical protein
MTPEERAVCERRITEGIARASEGRTDYWDFRDVTRSISDGALYQYPAMMVPELQRQVIAGILKVRPDIRVIADPFVGSGTVLAQAMIAGKQFVGQDINPLALLLCKTRAHCLSAPPLLEAAERVYQAALLDSSNTFASRFPNQGKWFTTSASIGLSRIKRAIEAEPLLNNRRFLWVCLAEAARSNSNSRTSTYKLHVKPVAQRNATYSDVLGHFRNVARRNAARITDFASTLASNGHLDSDGNYRQRIVLKLGDSMKALPTAVDGKNTTYDLVVTSPPYGDNRTTVPYGQAAWLPLNWIDLKDIDDQLPPELLQSAWAIDNASLGGIRSRGKLKISEQVSEASSAAREFIKLLNALEGDGLSRFVHFVRDLRRSIDAIAKRCTSRSMMVWTVGDRRIGGHKCPLMDIIVELFLGHDAQEIARVRRIIPKKRMPRKNGTAQLINEEFISVLKFSGLGSLSDANKSVVSAQRGTRHHTTRCQTKPTPAPI